MTSVEFGQRDVANEVRNRLEGFLDDDDSRRSKTVELEDRVPDELVQRVREEAADSRQAEADRAGQASLSDRERREIDFSKEGVNVPYARSVKGIADTAGVEDWIQYADFDLSVDENRRVLERAAREERGDRGRGRTQEQNQLKKGQQAKQRRREQAEGAKNPAFRGDTEAAEFLREEQRFEDDLFDVSLRGSGPSGSDFERLEDAHEARSKQAQRVDERRSAEVTRDPLLWAQNKAKYDYPGIDTVQPQQLHNQRSKRARRVDEEEQAPIADSREQWARNPDEYDWQGVDTKQRPSMDDIRERAERMKSARMDATKRYEPMSQTDDLMARASASDISFDPDLDTGQQDSGTTGFTSPGVVDQLAADKQAQTAFMAAEQRRGEDRFETRERQAADAGVLDPDPAGSSDPFDMSDGGMMADNRDQQASLDVGRSAGVTEDRSGEIAGSADFADRRDDLQPDNDPGEQAGLGVMEESVGDDGQADLFGGDATETSGAEYLR